jgi:hypothetical protein
MSYSGSGATLQTYVYKVWNDAGAYIGYYPTSPSSVHFEYSVLGKPVPLSVNISGPSTLNSGVQGTFTANPSGGSGTYTDYQWWERNDGNGAPLNNPNDPIINAPSSGTWLEITSARGQQTIQRGHSWNFSLKCEVTDSYGGKANDIHSVVISGNTPFEANANIAPDKFTINANYPNPFNPVTVIRYALPEVSAVVLEVYSLSGQKVAALQNGVQQAGGYSARFDGANLASGIYLYRFSALGQKSGKQFNAVKRMLLIK